jgi:hypothetical protein
MMDEGDESLIGNDVDEDPIQEVEAGSDEENTPKVTIVRDEPIIISKQTSSA